MTDRSCTIRPYEPADADAVIHCVRELQIHESAFEPRMKAAEEIGEDYLRHLIKWCEDCHGTILVADAGGEIVGYTCVLSRVPSRERDEVG